MTFRPIDLRFGPTGALYIADWSNPIIQHGEVDFRDPRRGPRARTDLRVAIDGVEGCRVACDRFVKLSNPELLNLTLSNNGWEQEQARVVLRQRGKDEVPPEVQTGSQSKRPTGPPGSPMAVREAFEQPAGPLLTDLASSPDERLRTAAARQLSRE